jgi:hypothetical protein
MNKREGNGAPLLETALPEFAAELEELVRASKEPELAAQVSKLCIARRCSCEDDFCATFYTQFDPGIYPRKDAHCLELEPQDGMIILDVVSGQVAGVEVLYRDDVRARLRALFP